MTARRTSAAAYRHLVKEGALPTRRREVYDLVYRFGPGTSAEILSHALSGVAVLTQSRARFTELRDMGLIAELGTRECSVTGRVSILWDVTERVEPLERVAKPAPAVAAGHDAMALLRQARDILAEQGRGDVVAELDRTLAAVEARVAEIEERDDEPSARQAEADGAQMRLL